MSTLLETKEVLKKTFVKYEAYIVPVLKFLLAFIVLLLINGKIGYMTKLNSVAVVLIAALFCSFMPLRVTALVGAVFMLGHFYALSIECALVTFVLLFMMFLLYMRFAPKETLVVLLTPLLFILKVPYVMPVAMGLLGGPGSIISVAFGVIISYLVEYTQLNATALTSMDSAGVVDRLRFVIDGLVGNKAMLVTVVAFTITILVVYFIRRRSMDNAWTIAIVSGVLTNFMILICGDLVFELKFNVLVMLLGTVVAGLIGKVIEFFEFNLDYNRTEFVQFEDDEYYYFVKAVPKIAVAQTDKKVKKISTSREPVNRTVASSVKTSHGVSRNMNGTGAPASNRPATSTNRPASSGNRPVASQRPVSSERPLSTERPVSRPRPNPETGIDRLQATRRTEE